MTRALKFFPLTFVCGTWGFNIFVPYMLLVMAAGIAGTMRRNANQPRATA